jgi:enoyl-CoA hydratase/carnithine racemase
MASWRWNSAPIMSPRWRSGVHRTTSSMWRSSKAIADGLDRLASVGARCVVLCSEGKHFTAGADFNASGSDRDLPGDLYAEAGRIFAQPLPIVAAVQGAAVGGGLGVAMAADFRVACPEARFSANFARLGFHQGFALSVTLPRTVGHQRAQEILFTGRRYTGDEALAMGLVDQLVPRDELRIRARELAVEIATSAPLAVASIRATLRAGLAEAAVHAMAHELAEQTRLRQTEDWNEGVAAMTERRPPQFTGR